MPNLLGNVPPRINELGRGEARGMTAGREGMIVVRKGDRGLAPNAPALITSVATGANKSIIRSRSDTDRPFR